MKAIDPTTAAPLNIPPAEPKRSKHVTPAMKLSSFAAVLTDLAVGESAIKQGEASQLEKLGTIASSISAWKEKLRDSLQAQVAAVKKRTGNKYSMEVTELLTPSGRFFILAIITRTE